MAREEELDLHIDRLALDEEWVRHPTNYFHWAKKAADAQADHDRAKSALDVIDAEIANDIRESPEDFGLTKATVAEVNATVLLQPEHQAAVGRVHIARHNLAIAQAAVNALEHKKRALSLLVELWIREYYADAHPKPKSEPAREMDKAAVRNRGRRRIADREDRVEDSDD